jgi:hypothetical protein
MLSSACAPGADLYSPASISSDGRLIRIHVAACHAELTAHVDERPDRVLVRVGARHGYDGDCGGRLDIHLSEPLGDRVLIDASDGEEIEVRVDDSLDDLADPLPVMSAATFIAALESREFTIEQAEGPVEGSPFTMTRYPFSHTVTNLRVDTRHLVTYEFPDGDIAERAAAEVSSDGYGVTGGQYEWIDTPHFWRSGRVIVLYLGDDQGFIEVLIAILGASFAGG